jgi:hypothetical protein
MDATGCPGRAELEGFVVGTLADPEFARIAGHVEGCPDCEESLRALDHLADPFLSRLRQSTAADASELEAETETVPPGLIEAVRSAQPGGREGWLLSGEGPRRLGKFEVLERLGAGSFGYVFRARDTELGRVVAIKIPRAGSLAGPEDVTRFFREARSAAQLQHPGIVSLHETGQDEDGTLYLIEEFVQGATLPAPPRGGRARRRGGRRPRLRPPPRGHPP